ncbi:hypothetical protein [Candidatus Albibeggiatoa sp. nov. BB20]|uniref:hypothetical protein n=1 Tax=Candidatus Albibeggiatoa sp. nov. BB20 TaxID=3162723 RepID=UPI0033658F70
MTTTLENAVTDLVSSTNKLTNEVIGKMAGIDQRVIDAETELNNHWLTQSNQINNEWTAKQIEIDAKLNAFDNRVIYVAPTTQNAGTGVDADNATTLADALSQHLIPSVANTIKLAKGLHVLPELQLSHLFLLNFEPADDYDPENPPIICTPNTVDSQISTNTIGLSSPSQICEAHAYDETPLHFHNSTIRFNNVQLRGTRHCVKFDKSTVFTLGDVHLDLWIYSASCTSHSGTALYATDSQIYSDAALDINIWHPDYTGCTDVLANHAAPILLDNSKQIQKGQLSWSSNIQLNEYPKQNTIAWRTEFEAAHATAINLINGAQLHIERLSINNVMQLFWVDNSIFSVSFMEMAEHSEPLQWLGQARGQNAQVSMTNHNADWYSIDDKNVVRIENTGTNPDHASLIAWDGAQVYLDGVKFTTTECPCTGFMTTETAKVLLQNSIIYAPDRDNNQGFLQIVHNTDGRVLAKNNELATRLGDNDVGFVTVKGGFTREENNQFHFSQDYFVNTYGRYQDSSGNTQGIFSFTEDKVIKVPEDYPDLETAVAAISDIVIAPSASITIELAEGEHVLSQNLTIQNLDNLTIKGADPIDKTLVSFVSATGSAKDWNVTLQINDATDVNVGDYLLIHDVTGTGIPEVHLGGWEVIAKSGNNLTIKHYCPEAVFPTNTVTNGSLIVITTKVDKRITLRNCAKVIFSNLVLQDSFSSYVSTVIFNNMITMRGCYISKGDLTVNNHYAATSPVGAGIQLGLASIDFRYSTLTINSCLSYGLYMQSSYLANYKSKFVSIYNLIGLKAEIVTAVLYSSVQLEHNTSIDMSCSLFSNFYFYYSPVGTPSLSPALNTVGNIQSYIAG